MIGIIRLICEEPLEPPDSWDGSPLVVDVDPDPDRVAAEVERLQAAGWQLISEWPL
jgi:hypothetical protein